MFFRQDRLQPGRLFHRNRTSIFIAQYECRISLKLNDFSHDLFIPDLDQFIDLGSSHAFSHNHQVLSSLHGPLTLKILPECLSLSLRCSTKSISRNLMIQLQLWLFDKLSSFIRMQSGCWLESSHAATIILILHFSKKTKMPFLWTCHPCVALNNFLYNIALITQILSISQLFLMQSIKSPAIQTHHPSLSQLKDIIHRNIQKISKKYSTSEWFYFVQNTNQYLSSKKNRTKAQLKELLCEKEEEMMQQYYDQPSSHQEKTELLEYYKYYTQTSITYQKGFYKLLQSHRERKKMIQYNKLKVILNFSKETIETSSERQKKDVQLGRKPYFNLLSTFMLSFEHQESAMIERLKCNLEKELGPNRHPTLEEIDKNYKFQKKQTEQSCTPKRLKKYDSKENIGAMTLKKSSKKHRNKSCETIIGHSKRNQPKHKEKGHQKSITNLYSPQKSALNVRKSLAASSKLLTCNTKSMKCTQTKESRFEFDLEDEVRHKIGDLKDQIRKEKITLKKKLIGSMKKNSKNGKTFKS